MLKYLFFILLLTVGTQAHESRVYWLDGMPDGQVIIEDEYILEYHIDMTLDAPYIIITPREGVEEEMVLYTYKCKEGHINEVPYPIGSAAPDVRCHCGIIAHKVLSPSHTNKIENHRYGQIANRARKK